MPHGKTKESIILTRELLLRSLDDTHTMMLMTINEVTPEDVEDTVMELLKYLEKTEPKEAQE
ncbi:hypothetical protein ES703_51671 [subsurface metagenome]